MNNKPIYVTFGEKKIEDEFEALKEGKFEDKQLYNFINRAIQDLKKIQLVVQRFRKTYGLKSISRSMALQIYGNMTCQMDGD
jgi:hypothetical protein